MQDGKIVEGCEPPDLIKAHDNARFSVSGREATAVAPKGRVCYINKEKNLKVGKYMLILTMTKCPNLSVQKIHYFSIIKFQ